MSDPIERFNIRVYGLLMNEKKEILLVRERRSDFSFTKFPGGGMDYGEGTIECLQREFKEETGLVIDVEEHFYTTDFFQRSAFHPEDQIISVYYRVSCRDISSLRFDEFEFIENGRPQYLRFFWAPMRSLTENVFSFPIDKKVCELLLREPSL